MLLAWQAWKAGQRYSWKGKQWTALALLKYSLLPPPSPRGNYCVFSRGVIS